MLAVNNEEAPDEAICVARTVTDLAGGRVAGAVKTPAELMVPIDVSPPSSPFTDHCTCGGALWSLITAVKLLCVPARTTLAPCTVMLICAGGPGGGGELLGVAGVGAGAAAGAAATAPPHPAITATSHISVISQKIVRDWEEKFLRRTTIRSRGPE